MHTTNYFNTLIEPAEDCPVTTSEVPPLKGNKKSVANLQYEMLHDQPYTFTSDDVLFSVFATRKGVADEELEAQRQIYFSKGQPCFRASPLTKRYGWGVHSNAEGKIALFAVDSADSTGGSPQYRALQADDSITKKKAMRSKRA